MTAIQISDAYLAPLIAASFVAVLSLMAWIVTLLLKISQQLADHGARIGALERHQFND